MKQNKVPGNGGFSYLRFRKSLQLRGRPLTPTGGVTSGPHGGGGGAQKAPGPPTFRLFDFPLFQSLKMVSDTSGSVHALGLIIQIYLILSFLLFHNQVPRLILDPFHIQIILLLFYFIISSTLHVSNIFFIQSPI